MWDFSALKFFFYQQKTKSEEYLFRIQLSIYNEFLFIIIIYLFIYLFIFFANIDNG